MCSSQREVGGKYSKNMILMMEMKSLFTIGIMKKTWDIIIRRQEDWEHTDNN